MKNCFFIFFLFPLILFSQDNCYTSNKQGWLSEGKLFMKCDKIRFSVETNAGLIGGGYTLTNLHKVIIDHSKYDTTLFNTAINRRNYFNLGFFNIGFGLPDFPLDFEVNYGKLILRRSTIDSGDSKSFDMFYDDNVINYQLAINSDYRYVGFGFSIPMFIFNRFVIRPRFAYSLYSPLNANNIHYKSNDSFAIDQEVADNLRNILSLNNFNALNVTLAFEWRPIKDTPFFIGAFGTLNFIGPSNNILSVKSNSYGINGIDHTVRRIKDRFIGFSLSYKLQVNKKVN